MLSSMNIILCSMIIMWNGMLIMWKSMIIMSEYPIRTVLNFLQQYAASTKYCCQQNIAYDKISPSTAIFCCRRYFVDGDILLTAIFCQRQYFVDSDILFMPRIVTKKFKTVLMGYSGAGRKLIHEKNQKPKILWHCPLKQKKLMWRVIKFCALLSNRWKISWRMIKSVVSKW